MRQKFCSLHGANRARQKKLLSRGCMREYSKDFYFMRRLFWRAIVDFGLPVSFPLFKNAPLKPKNLWPCNTFPVDFVGSGWDDQRLFFFDHRVVSYGVEERCMQESRDKYSCVEDEKLTTGPTLTLDDLSHCRCHMSLNKKNHRFVARHNHKDLVVALSRAIKCSFTYC